MEGTDAKRWRAPTRSVGRRPFKPQTVLLRQEADRGFDIDRSGASQAS
jgi:hypothetical protein